jgi:hypothetical protein
MDRLGSFVFLPSPFIPAGEFLLSFNVKANSFCKELASLCWSCALLLEESIEQTPTQ